MFGIADCRLIQLGKFGAFPARELLGLPYDIEYELVNRDGGASTTLATPDENGEGENPAFGQARGKKNKRKGKDGAEGVKQNPGWRNVLRPMKRRAVLDAVIGELFKPPRI